jgi:hypothetical protein
VAPDKTETFMFQAPTLALSCAPESSRRGSLCTRILFCGTHRTKKSVLLFEERSDELSLLCCYELSQRSEERRVGKEC